MKIHYKRNFFLFYSRKGTKRKKGSFGKLNCFIETQTTRWMEEGWESKKRVRAFYVCRSFHPPSFKRDVKVFCCHTNDYEIYFAQMIAKSKNFSFLMLLLFVPRARVRTMSVAHKKEFICCSCTFECVGEWSTKERWEKGCILDKHTLHSYLLPSSISKLFNNIYSFFILAHVCNGGWALNLMLVVLYGKQLKVFARRAISLPAKTF